MVIKNFIQSLLQGLKKYSSAKSFYISILIACLLALLYPYLLLFFVTTPISFQHSVYGVDANKINLHYQEYPLEQIFTPAPPQRGEAIHHDKLRNWLTPKDVTSLAFLTNFHKELYAIPNRQVFINNISAKKFLHPQKFSLSFDHRHIFFGNLHAHTQASDGKGSLAEAFYLTRDILSFDFYGLTDHAEYLELYKFPPYAKLASQLEKKGLPFATVPSTWEKYKEYIKTFATPNFVPLLGFEYTNHIKGHYTVFNTKTIASFWTHPTINSFYNWLKQPENQEAIVFFAHPQHHRHMRPWEFNNYDFDLDIKKQIIGIEVIYRNRIPPAIKNKPIQVPWLQALAKGWHVAPSAADDNHFADWGLTSWGRIGVIAEQLTEKALYKALQERRFYATQVPFLHFDAWAKCKNTSTPITIPMGQPIPCSESTIYARFAVPELPSSSIIHWQIIANGHIIKEQKYEPLNTKSFFFYNFLDKTQTSTSPPPYAAELSFDWQHPELTLLIALYINNAATFSSPFFSATQQ